MTDSENSASVHLLEAAAEVIPGGINSGRRNRASKICMQEASGAYLTSVDGRRYTDFHAAYGAIFLGHADTDILEFVNSNIARGVLFGIGVTQLEYDLARLIVHHVPSVEKVQFCNSGSEATYHAFRLARGATGRQYLLRFGGTYHGVHDETYATNGSLSVVTDRTLTCRYNDIDHVKDAIASHPEQVAAIVAEPIIHNAPGGSIMPEEGFLRSLRELCDAEGIVLIFDEVITGFRHGIGGYQAICGVTPDLTTMAKAIANGYPLAAVGGRAALMDNFDTNPGGTVAMGGTYNGNAVVTAAGIATIKKLENPEVYEHVYSLGKRMRSGLEDVVAKYGIGAHVGGYGSLFVLSFFAKPPRNHEDVAANDTELFLAYRRELLRRGMFEIPENVGRSHISAAHTEPDIDAALETADAALGAVLDGRART